MVYSYLKKGEGKLCSDYHGESNFAKKRKENIANEQLEREQLYIMDSVSINKINDKIKFKNIS